MPPLSLSLRRRVARASSFSRQLKDSKTRIPYVVCAAIILLCALAPLSASTLPAGFTEKLVASGITAPTAMAFAPDGRLFVCQQGGQVRVIKNDALLDTPFLTLPVDPTVERGLLGIAFDPNFATNRAVYVYYTTATMPTHNRISRFIASGDAAAPGSETVIFELDNLSDSASHNGGAMHFGSDGYLYIAVGDDKYTSNPQTLANRLGKILRINKNGTIPISNPFYSTATGNNRAIWALGLRNPFTFAVQPVTGRIFINDVGEGRWEEINEGVAGANYGWPWCEGKCAVPTPLFTDPLYQYGHGFTPDTGCAITGAAFYNPSRTQFPADYTGDYFFADYCGGWIKRFDPISETVVNFAKGIPRPVDLQVSPDGSLYYLTIGSGGQLYKVQHDLNPLPSIQTHPSNQLVTSGLRATFSVSAFGAQPLAYQWQKNGVNIGGATNASYTITQARLADNGAQIRCRVSNSFGSATSNSATLNVTTNRAPTAAIESPTRGTLYKAGDRIRYAGTATDPEDGNLPPSAFTWQVDFHHDTHRHPFIPPTSGARSGSFTIPALGETAPNVWYRIYLTVRDAGGFTRTSYRDVRPRKVKITLATSPSGLQASLDGQPQAAPSSTFGVVGIKRTIGVVPTQVMNGVTYRFVNWSDGGAASHGVTTPGVNKTYTAVFRPSGINKNHVISFDFDGDAKTDLGVWRPGTGAWIILNSLSGTQTTSVLGNQAPGDLPVPGDYDGDNRTDCAVWRPANGGWYILSSIAGTPSSYGWGVEGDVPVPGDYDGDGRTDLAVWRPVTGAWHILNIHNNQNTGQQWGALQDQPVPGDYDGDGRTDLAVWRPSTATFYILKSSDGLMLAPQLGATGDRPVPVDYDGDGKTDACVFHPASATWNILKSSDGQLVTRLWGKATDTLAPADYDGDGKTDLAIWRPSTATFQILRSSDGQSIIRKWGSPTTNDVAVPSAYIR